MMMLLLSATALVALTVVVHAMGTTYWILFLRRRYESSNGLFDGNTALPAVIWTALALLVMHIVEILLWALTYLLLLPGTQLDTVEKAVYFFLHHLHDRGLSRRHADAGGVAFAERDRGPGRYPAGRLVDGAIVPGRPA
jgi:hypothetical protein